MRCYICNYTNYHINDLEETHVPESHRKFIYDSSRDEYICKKCVDIIYDSLQDFTEEEIPDEQDSSDTYPLPDV